VAWRSRRATAIRLTAPFVFLLLALIVNLALTANSQQQARFKAIPVAPLEPIPAIPDCAQDLYMAGRTDCITFLYSPSNDTTVQVCGWTYSSSSGRSSSKQARHSSCAPAATAAAAAACNLQQPRQPMPGKQLAPTQPLPISSCSTQPCTCSGKLVPLSAVATLLADNITAATSIVALWAGAAAAAAAAVLCCH
jgi:hypothetical protein